MKAEDFYLNTINVDQKLMMENSFQLDLIDFSIFEAIKFLCDNKIADLFRDDEGGRYCLLYLKDIQNLLPIIPPHAIKTSRIEKLASSGLIDALKTEQNSGTWCRVGELSKKLNITFK